MQNAIDVEWKPCPGFPAYEVSESGLARRIKGGCRGQIVGRLIYGHINHDGYRAVSLSLGRGEIRRIFVHRLVCEAWHGPRPADKIDVAHFDGDKLNNHWSNLRWATRAENEADKRRHGYSNVGEKHPRARLSDADVWAIRARYSREHRASLANEYGVSADYITRVASGTQVRKHPLKAAA